MSIWLLLGMVFIAGAVGGLVSSLINDKGLTLPRKMDRGDGTPIFLVGSIGNTLTGAVAASVAWVLYGPLSQAQLGAGGSTTMALATLGGAVLVGMVGSAWLAKAAGQKLFQAAAYHAAAAPVSPDAAEMLNISPVDALKMAEDMHRGTGTVSPQDPGLPKSA